MIKFKHFGFYVHDMAVMLDFYTKVLRLPVTDRGRMAVPDSNPEREQELVFLSNNPTEHHQIILIDGRPASLPFSPINQISFQLDSLKELRQMTQRAGAAGASEIRPVTHGNAWSVYFRDPEGNRLECYVDTPWYIHQPFRKPLDLTLTDEAIAERTLELCRAAPGFQTRDEWIAQMTDMLLTQQDAEV